MKASNVVKIILEEGPLRDYARTDDAVKAFNMAVANGQARLAMEMLVPIINAITSGEDNQIDTGTSVEDVKEDPKPEPVKKASKAAVPKLREEEDQNLEK